MAEQALTFQLFPLGRAARGEAKNPGKGVLAQLGSGTHAPSNQLWSEYQSHVAQNEYWGLSAVSVYVGEEKGAPKIHAMNLYLQPLGLFPQIIFIIVE